MTELRWIGSPLVWNGVSERRFSLTHNGGIVPGILWAPIPQSRAVPLVLLGHGGSGHKRAERQLSLARQLAGGDARIAAVAIDGPFHGDRTAAPLEPGRYQEKMLAAGIDQVIDGMIDDWRETIDAIASLDTIDPGRVAYWGLSMGTRFGIPLAVSAGSRLRCAVFGKNGMQLSPAAPAALDTAARFTRDAPRLNIPVLYQVQWDDELFPRDGQFELFDLLGTRDKTLIAFPGPHGTTAPSAMRAWCDFLAYHLS